MSLVSLFLHQSTFMHQQGLNRQGHFRKGVSFVIRAKQVSAASTTPPQGRNLLYPLHYLLLCMQFFFFSFTFANWIILPSYCFVSQINLEGVKYLPLEQQYPLGFHSFTRHQHRVCAPFPHLLKMSLLSFNP